MLLHHSLLHGPLLHHAATTEEYSSTLSSDSPSEPSSPSENQVAEDDEKALLDGEDVFMDDCDDDEDEGPSSGGKRTGKPSGNQKVICDCKACCSMGKTRWVSKSTRSRHRRRFSVATPFSTASSPSVTTIITRPLSHRGRPRIQVPSSVVQQQQQQEEVQSASGAEGSDTPQHRHSTPINGNQSSMFLDGSDGSSAQPVVLVNRNLDEHLNPENFRHQQSTDPQQQEQKAASTQGFPRKVAGEDPVERITVTLFRDILSSLWTEFCA